MSDDIPISGRWFEELEVGVIFKHSVTRTVTETDNVLFTCMTMNPQALHLDYEFAAQSEFGRPLVNSLFTLGLLIGLTVHDLTQRTAVANLGLEKVEFPKPVFAGDTIRAETEIIEARLSKSRSDAGVVTFEHRAMNQRGELVARCRRLALMKRRAPQPSGH